MVFCIDYQDGDVLEWTRTSETATYTRISDYHPRLYVSGDHNSLQTIATDIARSPAVVNTAFVRERPGFRHDPEQVLEIAVETIDDIHPLAASLRDRGDPGEYQLYNVDFSREFRYCLEANIDPTPTHSLDSLTLHIPERTLANDHFDEITVGDIHHAGHPSELLTQLQGVLADRDPDVLQVNTADIVPFLYDHASQYDIDFDLGRLPGYQQLAGESTYESYGRVGHSPARYNVPGRVLIDESNTFFHDNSTLAGCLDLVSRSHKPLQELAWASIGNVLTAIQIREARDRNVLVPWNSWRHEFFKPMRTLHDADRGGFTFSPKVGVHDEVHELDFSSLYPNIICMHNISPETIQCDCHSTRRDVPELGYSICDDPGYLPDILQPLIDDRDDIKAALADTDDEAQQQELQGRSSALKWSLVACFGYQGFSNAKFGRIECHEAINAFAREILLDAKSRLEAHGWQVVHGIVDSIWVTHAREDATPVDEVAEIVSGETGIQCEHEAAYDWVAFVPRRNSSEGALTKYFGERTDGTFKYRGVECRQRSTCPFVEDLQRALIRDLGNTRNPDDLCQQVQAAVEQLERGDVPIEQLAITNRVSKQIEEYSQYTRNVAALERAASAGLSRPPRQSVEYVVVDDQKTTRERVALLAEDPEQYDTTFYRGRILRAAESVLSPLGINKQAIQKSLQTRENTSLTGFN